MEYIMSDFDLDYSYNADVEYVAVQSARDHLQDVEEYYLELAQDEYDRRVIEFWEMGYY
jgi:hypothetical protein